MKAIAHIGSPHGARWRPLLADAALWSTFAATALLLTVSEPLLDKFGYHYFTSGGFPWEKFHPGTLLATLALAARIASTAHPLRTAERLLAADPLVTLYFVSVCIAGAHATLVSHMPVTGLVETFLAPVVFCILLQGLDPRLKRHLALLMCVLLAANACFGFIESMSDWRVVSIDVPDGVSGDPSRLDIPFDPRAAMALDWRARALLGHPLENAVVTGALILCLAAPGSRWLASAARFGLLALSTVAMISFGGRASLVLSIAGALVFGLKAAAKHARIGLQNPRRVLAGACLAMPLVIGLGCALYASGFLDRTLDRFGNDDGSANARIVMWQMFEPQSWSNLLLGPDPALVVTWQRLLGIDFGVESFWLGLALTYGLIVGAILTFGLALFCVRVVTLSGQGAIAVFLYYFLVGSTSTSLSSKTVSFTIVIVLILLLLPPRPYEMTDDRVVGT